MLFLGASEDGELQRCHVCLSKIESSSASSCSAGLVKFSQNIDKSNFAAAGSPVMAVVVPPDPLPPDENVGPALTIINSILISLILVTTCIRVLVRFSIRALGMDDYTIIAVAILCVVRFALQVVQVNSFGNGRHRWYISEEDYMNNNRLGWYCLVLLFITMCLLKISICLLLLRIKDERKLKIFLYTIMAGLIITNLGCVVILLAQCQPISVYWVGAGGVCWDTRVRIYAIYATIGELLPTSTRARLSPSPCAYHSQQRIL